VGRRWLADHPADPTMRDFRRSIHPAASRYVYLSHTRERPRAAQHGFLRTADRSRTRQTFQFGRGQDLRFKPWRDGQREGSVSNQRHCHSWSDASPRGKRYRFRIIGITPNPALDVHLERNGKPVQWRAIAKDGVTLSSRQALRGPATLVVNPGETFDFEFRPLSSGSLRLTATSARFHLQTFWRLRC